ncbi:serine/threonine protein kinase [Burkholderiales bacterium JOSHI_001]|nr:serine/threonine protein kinase [Burkholderiales bacterium JOSHI_001]
MPTDPPHDDHNALPVGLRLGEFEIRRVLGSGGFGIVYVAFDRALEREVAIKEYMPTSLAGRSATHHVTVLSRSNAETFALGLRSFVNEAKLLARFDHPSLVKVLRFWEEHGTAYMAMPFYKGSTLKVLRQRMESTPDEAWLRKVCEALLGALEAMHKEGVYHRDISPDNIVVDEDGRPVLLDFGAARRVINDKSQALTAILKPNYAPIEQYAESPGLRQGPWTDIYALGATLHFLITGQPPMPATARALNDQRVPLQHLNIVGLPKPLLALIDWMLSPRPDNRPRDVAQVRAALAGRLDIPAAALPTPPAADDDSDWPQTQVFERTLPPAVATPAPGAAPSEDEQDDPDATIVRPASWRPVALAQAQTGAEALAPAAPAAAPAPVPPAAPQRTPVPPAPALTPAPEPTPVPPPPTRPASASRPEATVQDPAASARPARSPLPWLLGGGALLAAAAVFLFSGRGPETAPVSAPVSTAASAAGSASSSAVAAAASAAPAVPADAVTVIGAVPPAAALASAPALPQAPAVPIPASAPAVAAALPVAPPKPVASAPAPAAADPRAEARAAAASAAAAARLARAAASKPQLGNARTAQSASAASASAAPPAPSAAALPQPTPRAVVVAAPAAPAEPEHRDPNEVCGGKMLIALHRCLIRECVKPEFTQHPSCARARDVERRTQESIGNN